MATENKNVAKEAKNPVLTVRYWKDLKCYWLVWTLVYAFKIKPLIADSKTSFIALLSADFQMLY